MLEFSEVLEDIVRAAAVGRGLAEDAGEHFLVGVVVDDFDVIDDEVACGEETEAIGVWEGGSGDGHGERG